MQVDSPSLLKRSEQQAVKQFRRAAGAPFYRRLLSKHALRPSRVTSIENFKALVPVIAKRDVFPSHRLTDLLVDQSFDTIDTLISSSGVTAQSFSLGMINRTGTRSMVRSTDRLLDDWFDVGRKKTFLINTFAMGVKIPTSLPCIDLSVRSDKAIAIVQKLSPYFQQFIVTSDVFFLKKILEDSLAAGTNWNRLHAHFVIGGEWFPESYRRYLADLLHVDLSERNPPTYILASMGAAELGFNLCYETHDTVRLRQLAASDQRLCQALFGAVDTVPIIGHYDPRRWFIELTPTSGLSGGAGAFAFTNVDLRSAMPLIRYQTGDCGLPLVPRPPQAESSATSTTRICRPSGSRSRSWRWPVERMSRLRQAGKRVRMEFLRSVLYSDRTLASQTTGQFQARAAGDKWTFRFKCMHKPLRIASRRSGEPLFRAVNQHIPADVRVLPYFEFRHGMGVDYERKFSHLVRSSMTYQALASELERVSCPLCRRDANCPHP